MLYFIINYKVNVLVMCFLVIKNVNNPNNANTNVGIINKPRETVIKAVKKNL
jgi:hypothetical protein